MSDSPDTLTPARQALLDDALELVGLAFPAQEYLDAIAPNESPERQQQMGKESSCGLTLRAMLGRVLNVGLEAYADGSAFSILWELAGGEPWKLGGACRPATLLSPPRVGDAIFYDKSTVAVAHVDACVVAVGPYDGGTSLSVDVVAGGQRDDHGNECIKRMTRRLRWTGSRWLDLGSGRVVAAVLDADLWPHELRSAA